MDSRVAQKPVSSAKLAFLAALLAFGLMAAVAKLPSPWWQRLLGPLFGAAGLFLWIPLRHTALRAAPAALRPWIFLAAGAAVFAGLRLAFPPIAPPPPDPFIERLPAEHLDWHTLLASWLPWPLFFAALAGFSRSFREAVAAEPVHVLPALAAAAGLGASAPGIFLPMRTLDFFQRLLLILAFAAVVLLPVLAKSRRKA